MQKHFRIYKKLITIFVGKRLLNTILSIKSSLKNKTILNFFFPTNSIYDLLHHSKHDIFFIKAVIKHFPFNISLRYPNKRIEIIIEEVGVGARIKWEYI